MNLGNLTDKLPDQFSKYLDGLNFPAEKQDVVEQAKANQADSKVVTALEKLPPGVYNSVNDVVEKTGASGMLGKA